MKKTFVYVDGFNLYYGCLKGSKYKWLDLLALSRQMLPSHEIVRIKYFTATVSSRPDDPNCSIRQQVYLRALMTLPLLEIHMGHFLSHKKTLKLVEPIGNKTFARVLCTEEKGSDVNLASHLLLDGAKDSYESAVVISNDSDLLTPVRMVKKEFRKNIGLLNPHPKLARALSGVATFYKPIRSVVLQMSQFPSEMKDDRGKFHKPDCW